MVSRTKLLSLIKSFDWRAVQQGLQESPELLAHRDERGRNLLHLCCMVNVEKNQKLNPKDGIKLAALLIDAGLDISAPAFERHNWQATPLWHAFNGCNYDLAAYLLKRGCDPEHCLWGAAMGGDVKRVKLLLKYGAEVDPVYESDGSTPLLLAVKKGHWAMAAALLQAGADPNIQDPDGRTALHWALRHGEGAKDTRKLLDAGARGDIADAEGRTAAAIMRRKKDPAYRRMAERYFGAE